MSFIQMTKHIFQINIAFDYLLTVCCCTSENTNMFILNTSGACSLWGQYERAFTHLIILWRKFDMELVYLTHILDALSRSFSLCLSHSAPPISDPFSKLKIVIDPRNFGYYQDLLHFKIICVQSELPTFSRAMRRTMGKLHGINPYSISAAE